MNSLETALRGALSKGDASDPEYRRRVYESAANAIHKTLAAKGNVPPKAFEDQRMRLADIIRTIESEMQPNTARASAGKAAPAPQAPPELRAEPRAPEVSAVADKAQTSSGDAPKIANEPSFDSAKLYAEPRMDAVDTVAPAEPAPVMPDQKQRKIRRKAPFAKFLTGAVAIGLLGIGLLWAITTDIFLTDEQRDTSVPNPEQQLQSESFEGREPEPSSGPQTLSTIDGNAEEWVTLFSPIDPTTLGLVGGAAASIEQSPFGDFARLELPDNGSEVQIDIPLNVLQQSAGKTIQLSLQASTDAVGATQMSVTCDLGTLAQCRRVRFNVGQATNEYLLQVPVAQNAQASGIGMIKIKTDIDGGPRTIQLLQARARILDN